MDAATVHSAAQTSGWSVRMLHYLDAAGLVSPPRSTAGYRLYGAGQIARLRELRRLLAEHDLRPADLQVALRLRTEPELRRAVDGWLEASRPAEVAGSVPIPPAAGSPAPAGSPTVDALSWLRFEQDKHSRGFRTDQPSTDQASTDQASTDQLNTDQLDPDQPNADQQSDPSTDHLTEESA